MCHPSSSYSSGVDLIKPIKGDPRNPHATFICEMCDCFFCDDLAKIIHCKGRRHRLNYKVIRMYQLRLGKGSNHRLFGEPSKLNFSLPGFALMFMPANLYSPNVWLILWACFRNVSLAASVSFISPTMLNWSRKENKTSI